jgi:hypothetical protein
MVFRWKNRRKNLTIRRDARRPVLDYETEESSKEERDDEDLSDREVLKELLKEILAYVVMGILTLGLIFLYFSCD